jgi:glutaredoxin
MMVLYSGTNCPFSQRCRLVLFEKGMDFEIRDVDLFNKPEDISVMNPYGQVPILVERDLILYESNIINEYIDERFPHPQLMPPDPVARARARLFLFNFEKELFVHVASLENEKGKAAAMASYIYKTYGILVGVSFGYNTHLIISFNFACKQAEIDRVCSMILDLDKSTGMNGLVQFVIDYIQS